MSNQSRMPDAKTRARSVAKLRELRRRWDTHILDMDELIARLEADIRSSTLIAYRLGNGKQSVTEER